jgi:hypothetical protein
MQMRRISTLIAALLCLMSQSTTTRAQLSEIWFNPNTPLDWRQMFTPTAPWQMAANQVNVMEIEPFYLLEAGDPELLNLLRFIQLHHMKVDVDVESIAKLPGACMGTTEGYRTPAEIRAAADHLLRLGFEVNYIHIDEPLWFGHYDPEAAACQFAAPDLASHVAQNINQFIADYPDVQVVEIETFPNLVYNLDWQAVLDEFQNLVAQQIGRKIQGVQLDVNWNDPGWAPSMVMFDQFLRQRNQKLGVIYDGTGAENSSLSWMTRARNAFETVEGYMGLRPAQVIFASWYPFPQYNMPETDPTAQTWLIDSYARTRTTLSVYSPALGANGLLTTEDGTPIPNATIQLIRRGVIPPEPLPVFTLMDTVPAGATQALIGVRMNSECSCQGNNDILLGAITYQETAGGSLSAQYSFPFNIPVYYGVTIYNELSGTTPVLRFIMTPDQSVLLNSPFFPVTPGAHFTLSAPTGTVGGNGWYGNIVVIWADANGNGVGRGYIIPNNGVEVLDTEVTDANGKFTLARSPPAINFTGSSPVTVQYPGDATHFPSGWAPPSK